MRRLFGSGKGKFSTKGYYGAATVRGTKWLTRDYCDRTVFNVTEGTIVVRDYVKKRNITVRKGKSYSALKPKPKRKLNTKKT